MSSIKTIGDFVPVIVEHLVNGVMSREDFDIAYKFIIDKARNEHRMEIMEAYCALSSDPDSDYWPSFNYYNETFNTKDK